GVQAHLAPLALDAVLLAVVGHAVVGGGVNELGHGAIPPVRVPGGRGGGCWPSATAADASMGCCSEHSAPERTPCGQPRRARNAGRCRSAAGWIFSSWETPCLQCYGSERRRGCPFLLLQILQTGLLTAPLQLFIGGSEGERATGVGIRRRR